MHPEQKVAGDPSGTVAVLCVNIGSSTLKSALFEIDAAGGETGRCEERLRWSNGRDPVAPPELGRVRDELRQAGLGQPSVVAHRVVHGGPHIAAQVVDDRLLDEMRELIAYAPLHQAACVAGVIAARETFPAATQVATFDTAFHHTMPEVATHLGLPRDLWAHGIRRYGFHGLSYQNVVDVVGAGRLGRAVVAHLGSGASLCAVRDGRSVDTTMGLTPAGGLVMATRAGDLDPGVLIHLLRHGVGGQGPLDADDVEDLVNHHAGLEGLSGTADMRTLLDAQRAGDSRAEVAVAVFCRTVTKGIGSLAAALGGIDTIVFTGGIGEHAAEVRRRVCEPLEFLGVRLDRESNAQDRATVSAPASPVTVRIVTADEERVMAHQAITATAGATGSAGPTDTGRGHG